MVYLILVPALILTNLIHPVFLQTTPKLSPGIVYEEETGQILYEATAPIIYQFEVPQWDDFLAVEIKNCRNDPTISEYCPIFEIIESISKDIQSAAVSTFSSFPQETSESTWGLKCNYLGQHFSSIRVDPLVLQKYLSFLRSCSKGMMLEEALNAEYASKPFLNHFEVMKNIFEIDFHQNFDSSGDSKVHQAVGLNFYDNLLSLGIASFISETIRWNSAIQTCKAGRIPESLVTPTMFHESLIKLNESLYTRGWTFVVNAEEQFLPLYFKNQLADCTFSGNKFIVRILTPIKRTSRHWIHVSYQAVPFYMKQDSTEIIATTLKDIDENGSFFYEKVSKRLYKAPDCDTSHPGFCRLPELWDKTFVASATCLKNLLGDQDDIELPDACSIMEYFNIKSVSSLPLVIRNGTDTFYLAGLPSMSLKIECTEPNGTSMNYEFPFPQEKGSLEVKLPCFCKILTEGIEYESEAPCQVFNDKLLVSEVWHQGFVLGN